MVVLMGATGTGKTRLAIDVATRARGEVVNADSMQVYRTLNIMAAKASVAERASVPHHCMDLLPVTDVTFNAARFVSAATAAIDDIHTRGHLPVVVGGTHQYLEALLWSNFTAADGAERAAPALNDAALAAAVLARLPPPHPAHGSDLYALLKAVDPLSANKLRETDARKIRRALEHFAATGTAHSAAILAQRMELRYEPCVLWLDTEREALYARLDRRVDAMLAAGLLAEAETVRAQFAAANQPLDFTRGALQAIGFKELEPYLADDARPAALLAQCVADMKTRSRNYARSQLKWVEHHFRTRLPVFRVDTTHPDRWADAVLPDALAVVEDFAAGRAYRVPPLPVLAAKQEVQLDQWRKHRCEYCERELNGQAEWDAHVKSRGTPVVLFMMCLPYNTHRRSVLSAHTSPPLIGHKFNKKKHYAAAAPVIACPPP